MIAGVLLAAGRGQRLRPLTDYVPKCLTKLNGTSLLERVAASFTAGGVEELVLVAGYRHADLQASNLSALFSDIQVNREWATTNMVWSLLCVSDILERRVCIVSYTDIFYDASLIADLISCDEQLAIAYDPNGVELWTRRFSDPLEDIESFKISSAGEIQEIGGSVQSLSSVDGQYMGVLKFTPTSFTAFRDQAIELVTSGDFGWDTLSMTAVLQAMVTSRVMTVHGVPYRGIWGEIDSVDDLSFFSGQSV